MSDQVLLRDLVVIPDEVHAGDFVLSLSKGIGEKSTITDYVVTEPLARNFDRALGLIKSAVETNASRAAYLDGSFGSGKSHFLAVLYAILSGDPAAPRTAGQVYGCLGCSAQCGRCARTIRRIMDEALGGAETCCQAGGRS